MSRGRAPQLPTPTTGYWGSRRRSQADQTRERLEALKWGREAVQWGLLAEPAEPAQ